MGEPLSPPWPKGSSPTSFGQFTSHPHLSQQPKANWAGGDSHAGEASSPTHLVLLKESHRVLLHLLPFPLDTAQLYLLPLGFLPGAMTGLKLAI